MNHTMDQPAEPTTGAMHNVQRRRGSVGTTQLFDNIVSTSNCMSCGSRMRFLENPCAAFGIN